jgi:hypothetical protein
MPPRFTWTTLCCLLALSTVTQSAAQAQTAAAQPFAFGDFTWMTGTNRQHKALLDSPYFTGSALLDINYAYAFARPIDNTLVGSTTTGRHNELNLLLGSLGGDLHVGDAHATLTLQVGSTATLVPRNDPSVNRGQYDLATAYRFVREAYAGYHFNVLGGLNLDAGIFMSYVGLFSYLNAENWAYQPSFVSDNTPFFFQGLRAQLFPNEHLKVELWLINGWQTYAKFNSLPGVGYQVNYRPCEALSLVSNGYAGTDTKGQPHRVRLHSDNSVVWRYYNAPEQAGLHRAALSFTVDVGGESGGGVQLTGKGRNPAQNFVGAMAYNRLWFVQDTLGLTLGGGYINNPGRYLVLAPPGLGAAAFSQNPGDPFSAWDASITLDYMPNETVTLRLEGLHRWASVPYFAGRGGVTSTTGYLTDATPGFRADLRRSENRVHVALMFRL